MAVTSLALGWDGGYLRPGFGGGGSDGGWPGTEGPWVGIGGLLSMGWNASTIEATKERNLRPGPVPPSPPSLLMRPPPHWWRTCPRGSSWQPRGRWQAR